MTDQPRPRMAPAKDAPPGLELDGKGNVIPFEERTQDDQQKVMNAIADKLHGVADSDSKPPENTTDK